MPSLMMFSFLLQKYHPTRALTLVYQPFALGTMAILAYNESKIDTRKRNITGYTIFFASTLALLLVSSVMLFSALYLDYKLLPANLCLICNCFLTVGFSHIWRRRTWTFSWCMCVCCFVWSCRCPCSRWYCWGLVLHVP